MTTPSPEQEPNKLFTPALLAALAGLVVLAVVTLIVVVVGDDATTAHGNAGTNGTTSAAPGSSEPPSSSAASAEPEPGMVIDEDLKVSYTYPMNGYDEFDWAGPDDLSAGIVDLSSATSYAACEYQAGSDVLFGLLTSEESDLAQAAKIGAVDLSKSVWSSSGEATTTDPTAPLEKTTNDGIVGQIVEMQSTRANGEPDQCGTTTAHIAAFAFENADGQVIVMVSSHRTDGAAVKDADSLADDVATTFESLALV